MVMLYRNPVSLNQLTIFQTLILQHAAAAQNGLGRSRIIFVASHQRTVNPQLFGNGKGHKKHLGSQSLASAGRTDAVSDMPTVRQQIVV